MFDDRDAIVMSPADRERMKRAASPKHEEWYDIHGQLYGGASAPDMVPVDFGGGVVGYYHKDEVPPPSETTEGDDEKNTGGVGEWDNVFKHVTSIAIVILGIVLIVIAILNLDYGEI